MLEKAFIYSVEDSLENTDKLIRCLKGALVQKIVRNKLKEDVKKHTARLEQIEKKPVPGIDKDIYGICNLLRLGTNEVQLWKNEKPAGKMTKTEIKKKLREIMNELNDMGGQLCDALEIQTFDLATARSFDYPAGRRKIDGA